MEKISKIIAGSPRVTSTDMSKERPVRAGTPSFGAPIAVSDSATRYDALKPADKFQPDLTKATYGSDGQLNEKKQVQIVKDLEAKFFSKPSDSIEPVIAPKSTFATKIPDIAAEMAEASAPPATVFPQAVKTEKASVDIYA